jgi:8-oxo-dGTP pyrophosphatase MutT (NUDIX family)
MECLVPTLVQIHVVRLAQPNRWEHLLLRRSLQDDTYPGLWQPITGRIGMQESPFAAARRELAEEIGVAAEQWWSLPLLAPYYDRRSDAVGLALAFGAVIPSAAPITLTEHCDYQWLDAAVAQRMLVIPAQQEGIALLERFLSQSTNWNLVEQIYRLQ